MFIWRMQTGDPPSPITKYPAFYSTNYYSQKPGTLVQFEIVGTLIRFPPYGPENVSQDEEVHRPFRNICPYIGLFELTIPPIAAADCDNSRPA